MIDEKNDPDSAIKIYEKAINDDDIARYPYDRLVILYRKRKQYDDEIRVLDKRLGICNSMMIKGHTDWIEEYCRVLDRKEKVYQLKNEKFVRPNLEFIIPANFSGCQNKYDKMKRIRAMGLASVKGDVEFLINVLADSEEDGEVRRSAAFALGSKKDKRATDILIKILEDYHLKVVFHDGNVIKTDMILNESYGLNGSLNIRTGAAMALGKIKDPRSIKSLINALNDKNPSVVANSAYALGEIKDKEAVEPLIEVIMGENPPKEAVVALKKLKDKRAINPLKNLVKSHKTEYESTINSAIRKLERIK